jgi:hypothetical protein
MYNPSIATDNGATRNKFTTDFHALLGYDTFKYKTGCGMKTERLLDDSIEVGKFLSFGPRNGLVRTRFDDSVCDGVV